MTVTKNNTATFLAILFHVSGWIGIVFSPYKHWFIANTPLNLCLMAVLLLWNQPRKNLAFFLFLGICFLAGMGSEMIGVNTGSLFGVYTYGNILGAKLNGVPWLIGLNWFVVVYCSGSCMSQFHQWFTKKMVGAGTEMSPGITALSLIIDGALLATGFDWIMEPVAMKLGFWHWQNSEAPLYNYLCWFIISGALLMVFRRFSFEKPNQFAVHLLIIQGLFFLALRIQLV